VKILLVNPWITDVAAYDFWLKPVGLLVLADKLRGAGHEVCLLDCLDRLDPGFLAFSGKTPGVKPDGTGRFFHEPLPPPPALAGIPRRFKRYGFSRSWVRRWLEQLPQTFGRPDRILVTSMMTYWYPGVWEMVGELKGFFPGVPVLLGGVYASLLPEHAALSGASDVCSCADLGGVRAFLERWGITLSPGEALVPDYTVYTHAGSHLVYVSSVGCVNRCTYCATPLLQPFTQNDPGFLLERMVQDVSRMGIRNVAFFDDALLVHHEEHFDVVLKGIIAAGLPQRGVRFHLPNGIHARHLTFSTAQLLFRANVQTIKIGLETIDPHRQRTSGGKVATEEFVRAVGYLQQAGFSGQQVAAYLIANLPGQTEQELLLAKELCERLGIRAQVNEYTPIPRTHDFQQLVEKGLLPAQLDPLLLNNSLLPYWWKAGMDAETIDRIKNVFRTKSR